MALPRIVALFPDLSGVGGVQEAGRQSAAALAEIARDREFTLSLLALNDPPGNQSLQLGAREIQYQGFGRRKAAFLASVSKLAHHDVRMVLAGHPNLAVPAALMKKLSPGMKAVVNAHGIEVWNRLPWYRRRALLAADCVLAPSRDTVQKLSEVQGVSPSKVRLLPWPVNSRLLQLAQAPSALALPDGIPRGRIVLAVGRWDSSERYKGLDDLIRAIAGLRADFPDLSLVAVGGGDDLPRHRQLAADLGVADAVCFLQGLAREELAACYAHAEVFALPSTGEGFGLVFLEAMAFARPVVGADCGGAKDLILDGVNGFLVQPGDPRELGRALERLLRDENLRRQLGRKGAEIVNSKYRFEVFRKGLESTMQTCGVDSQVRA